MTRKISSIFVIAVGVLGLIPWASQIGWLLYIRAFNQGIFWITLIHPIAGALIVGGIWGLRSSRVKDVNQDH